MKSKDLRGTWPQALGSLAISILFILTVRWALFEPYVIPSGSMIPTLLIHDHILVNKFAYGLRVPFTSDYLLRWSEPKPGDVLVFRSVENSDIFLVKRLVGRPGDEVTLSADGRLSVNKKLLELKPLSEQQRLKIFRDWPSEEKADTLQSYQLSEENLEGHLHPIMKSRSEAADESHTYKVPPKQFFMMGDNRDNSADSRYWGFLPEDRVLGRASAIWLSCTQLLPTSQICDPNSLRSSRIFTLIR
jgi:signal peptidase I